MARPVHRLTLIPAALFLTSSLPKMPTIDLVRGINQKGLFTYDGQPKPAVAAVRRGFEG